MKSNRALALVGVPSLAMALTLLLAPAAQAASDFDPAAGSYTINTTNLTLTGPGGTDITGTAVGGVAVFSFNDVSIGSGVTITATGSLPVQIEAAGTFTLAGTIDGNGTAATPATTGANAGGPGGGAGGTGSTAGSSSGNGSTGGKPGTTSTDGAGGGGFGGAGGAGGTDGGAGGAGGAAGGSLTTQLQGGSGGAGGDDVGGGGAGGGIELNATSLTISATGQVLANGGAGAAAAAGGGSGGGSGGGILLAANTLDVAGTVNAKGGAGGAGGSYGGGGGGGGGRVTEAYVTLTAGGTPKASAGAASTGTPGGHAGTKGSAKTDQVGSVQTTAATGVSGDSATLNGNLNPNGQTTTYQFQYGTTTAYGTTEPPSPASGGKATITTPESVDLIGLLTPGTTYHFRIVGYSDGVTLYGADETFKTPVVKPLVTTGRARDVKKTSAKVKGSVTPGGGRTKYYVQYYIVKRTVLSTHAKKALRGNDTKSVSLGLKSLSAATWYHYRIVAKDKAGTTRGRWRSFRTKG